MAARCLAAIQRTDEGPLPIRAFISVLEDDLYGQAEASSERHATGEPLGLLDGIPIAVKDEVDQTPHPTTVGTAFLGQRRATDDAAIVARLRRAGALLVGKTNMHEIGINPNGQNVHHGLCRNPYDRTRDAGGSSSGSAAAVAAGICPVAIGADGGGSIRIPAAHCGLVGLKPTFGRISEHGAAPLTWSMGHLGPIGATVADCAAVYAAGAGPDPHDPHSLNQPPPTLAGWALDHLDGVRLGVCRPWFEHASDEVVSANETLLSRLVDAGATMVPLDIPELDEMRVAHAIIILSEMAASMAAHIEQRRRFAPAVRLNLAIGRSFSASDYIFAQRMRTRALRIFDTLYDQADAIVTPATGRVAADIPAGAWPHGWSDLSTETEIMRFVFPANLTGLPAISFPAGYADSGLPVGMQVMARHWQEALLLRIANVAQRRIERRAPADYTHLLQS